MFRDPIVEEVRKARDDHAAKFKYNVNAIYRALKSQEKKEVEKLFHFHPNGFLYTCLIRVLHLTPRGVPPLSAGDHLHYKD